MLNKKGIEGLPLKYLVIALVASVVIALALQMTSMIQGSVIDSTDLVAESITGRIIESNLGDKYTLGFKDVRILAWSFNSSNGRLTMSIINNGYNVMNIDYITAIFNDISDNSTTDRLLKSSESTPSINFDLSQAANVGDRVSINVIIVMTDDSFDRGSLVGIAQ